MREVTLRHKLGVRLEASRISCSKRANDTTSDYQSIGVRNVLRSAVTHSFATTYTFTGHGNASSTSILERRYSYGHTVARTHGISKWIIKCTRLPALARQLLSEASGASTEERHKTSNCVPQRFILDLADGHSRGHFSCRVLDLVIFAVQLAPEVKILEAAADRQHSAGD